MAQRSRSKTARLVRALAPGAVLLLSIPSRGTLAADAGAPALPACVEVATQSRYVPYGYNHVVVLRNGCSRAASCTISTDVNPQPRTAEVPAGGAVEVLTFMASPSRTFTASVACQLRR